MCKSVTDMVEAYFLNVFLGGRRGGKSFPSQVSGSNIARVGQCQVPHERENSLDIEKTTAANKRVEDQLFCFSRFSARPFNQDIDVRWRVRASMFQTNHQQQDYDEPDVAEAPLTALSSLDISLLSEAAPIPTANSCLGSPCHATNLTLGSG